MSKLTQRAEIFKLAHLLGLDAGALHFLEQQDAEAIGELRKTISNTLFDRHHGMFQRIAGTSRILPTALLTVIAEKAVGPFLCAHIAGHMPTERAIDMAVRLPIPFLADVCVGIDPRRVVALLRGIPIERAIAVSREMIRRQDYVTMGRFVGALPDFMLKPLLDDVRDDHVLLQIAFYTDDKAHLNHIIGMLPEARIRRIIVAANTHALWPEALGLMTFVNEPLSRMLGDVAVNESDEVLAGMIRALHEHELWSEILPIVAWLSEPSQQRFINLPVAQEPVILQSIINAAQALKLWAELLPLVRLMEPAGRQRISGLAAALDEVVLGDIISAAAQHGLWLAALDLVQDFAEAHQAELALALARQSDATLASLLKAVAQGRRWEQLIRMADTMSVGTRQQLIERGIGQDGDIISRLLKAAEDAGVWDEALAAMVGHADTLLALAQQLPPNMQKSLIQDSLALDAGLLSRLVEAAGRTGVWEFALHALAASPPELREGFPAAVQKLPSEQQTRLRERARELGLENLLVS
jgi:hypothetical protein